MVYNVLFAYGLDGMSYTVPHIAQPSPEDRSRLFNLLNCEIKGNPLSGAHPQCSSITGCVI
eukprot:COSAG02_NODE_46422_length_349_cov_0.612000_1_plen_60_part_01